MPEFDIAATPSATKPTLADDDRLLTPAEASELVGLSINTLRDYRSTRGRRYGPPFHMHDRKIVYCLSELLDWMDTKVNDRQFEQIITAAKSLPQEKQEMTQPHEFAKLGHLPDAYYDQFGNVRADMMDQAVNHLAKAHRPQVFEVTESTAEKTFYAKVDALTAEGADFVGACAQVTATEPELAKRAFGH